MQRTLGSVIALILTAALLGALPPVAVAAESPPGTVTLLAGGTAGSGPATNFGVVPAGLARIGSSLLIADDVNNVVRAVDLATGNMTIFAGTGGAVRSGMRAKSGPALDVAINPTGPLAVGAGGNVYLAADDKVLRVDPSGRIHRLNGLHPGETQPPGPPLAAYASFSHQGGLAADDQGNIFVSQIGGSISRIDSGGRVYTVVPGHNGQVPGQGDGGPASSATVTKPMGILVDRGSIYIADMDAHKIRRIDPSGNISTFAGTGTAGAGGDGGPASEAQLYWPVALASDGAGNIFIAENHRVRKVDAAGMISTVAGSGEADTNPGDPATANLHSARSLATDGVGNVYVADDSQNKVQMVSAGGELRTIAGNGGDRMGGDGGPARLAQVNPRVGSAVDAAGNYYFVDDRVRIRRVDASGVITTVAGTAKSSEPDVPFPHRFTGEGGPANQAHLGFIEDMVLDSKGNILISVQSSTVHKIDATTGLFTRYAGCGMPCQSGGHYLGGLGEGGPALEARLLAPKGLAIDRHDNLYIAESGRGLIRKVSPSGIITTVAGDAADPSGRINADQGVVVDTFGNLFLGGGATKVDAHGVVTPFVGSEARLLMRFPRLEGGFGIPASTTTASGFAEAGPDGSLYLARADRHTIARVGSDGLIYGGGGESIFLLSDGAEGPIPFRYVRSLALDAAGNAYIASAQPSEASGGTQGDGPVAIRKLSQAEKLVPHRIPVAAVGWNALGQLGDGSKIDSSRPRPVSGLTATTQLAAGFFHTLALAPDGSVSSWGYNGFGQLGDGSVTDRSKPVRVKGLSDVVAISAGAHHSLAVKRDGTVWAWGFNALGQLGDGTKTDRRLPVRVNLVNVESISGGAFHALAVKRDGTVWAWGFNALGQLGDGGRVDRSSPVKLALDGVKQVSAGGLHSLGLKNDGSVVAWGWNVFGQLGDGSTEDRLLPITVPEFVVHPHKVTKVSAGYAHSVALTDNADAKAWGWNILGQLGAIFPQLTHRVSPSDVSWTYQLPLRDISAGLLHTAAASMDGTAVAWGYNGLGQTGLNPVLRVDRMERIPGTYGVSHVAAGAYHSVAGITAPGES